MKDTVVHTHMYGLSKSAVNRSYFALTLLQRIVRPHGAALHLPKDQAPKTGSKPKRQNVHVGEHAQAVK